MTDWKFKVFTWVNRKFGYEIWNYKGEFPPDFEAESAKTIRNVARYTSGSAERVHALIQAVEYIVQNKVPGDFVECGVWRGGSMMAMAETLLRLGQGDRQLYLYDTFSGMPQPGDKDVSFRDEAATVTWNKLKRKDFNQWCYAPVDEVRENMHRTGYNPANVHLIQGLVEETIPTKAPNDIALLRLDTDWYESVRHELIHLFPRLSRGGILIVDDYGHWMGARQATDEYFRENRIPILLNRIDYTARIAVKY
ncbi:MAG: TylF/MycF/NovP-related O-methyltransferase [Acidobacteriota bacterium]